MASFSSASKKGGGGEEAEVGKEGGGGAATTLCQRLHKSPARSGRNGVSVRTTDATGGGHREL